MRTANKASLLIGQSSLISSFLAVLVERWLRRVLEAVLVVIEWILRFLLEVIGAAFGATEAVFFLALAAAALRVWISRTLC